MDEQIENRLIHIHWSTYLYNTSLSELQIISDENYNYDEIKIINSHTFDFYRVTLMYCFIMEYCKLLEKGKKENEHNISSLNRLNEILLEHSTKDFQTLYNENVSLLENIKKSDFYNKIRNLRNKKFGHADNDKINKPFKVDGFDSNDFEDAFRHLQMIKIVFNNFGSVYDREYDLEIPSRDTRTKSFIKSHADYQTYFIKNYLPGRVDHQNEI
jgi:hypothetical protein